MNLEQLLAVLLFIKGEYGGEIDVSLDIQGNLDDFENIDSVAVVHKSNHSQAEIVFFWNGSRFNAGLRADSPFSMVIRFFDGVPEIVRRPTIVCNTFKEFDLSLGT